MLRSGLEDLEHTSLTQYPVNKGLQVLGEAGFKSVLQKIKQLHLWEVDETENPNIMTKEENKKAL